MWPFQPRTRTTSATNRHTLRRRPRVEPLEDRFLLSATIVESEINNAKSQADSFAIPEDGIVQLQGTSQSKDDKDFFRFTAGSVGTVNVAVSSASGPLAKLEFKDNLGNELFETEPNDGVNGGSVTLVAGRTYFLRLRSPNRSAAQYVVDLNFAGGGGGGGGGGGSGPVFNESESNNKKGVADLFALDASGAAQLVGTSQDKDDKDFFVFKAQSSGTLNVIVESPNDSFAQFEIEDRFGVSLFETEPNDGVNSGSVQVVEGMTYYLRLRAKEDAPAAYNVSLSLA